MPPHALTRACAAQTEELRRRLAAAESARAAECARAETAERKEREVAPVTHAHLTPHSPLLSGCSAEECV